MRNTISAVLAVALMFLAGCPAKKEPKPSPQPSCYTTEHGTRECGLNQGVQPASPRS